MNIIDMISKIRYEIHLGCELAALYEINSKYSMREAEEKIKSIDGLSDQKKAQYLKLFKQDLKKTGADFSEWYYAYKMYELSDKEKKSYLTRQDMLSIYKKNDLLYPGQIPPTRYKDKFLRKYAAFVHRKWIVVTKDSDPEETDRFNEEHDTIVKPKDGSLGKDIIKLQKGTKDASEIVSRRKLPVILEECVENIRELAEFHAPSLNTIRIVTLSNGTDVRILGCALRTGVHGNVCDNAEAGGFFAAVDPDSGIVLSNGFSKSGEESAEHPDSGKVFKGFHIPMWEEVRTACIQAALVDKRSMLVGWDFAVTTQGVELIEGNSHPGILTLQVPLHEGIRGKFFAIMKELHLQYRDVLFWIWLIRKAAPAMLLKKKIRAGMKRMKHCIKNTAKK